MGESACLLRRTYSQPSSSSPKSKQVELFRCLTSSTSLGRYMSESLDWEKWSTFKVNRHMEDVKKHSRPGAVAQMKAHFEALFKRKATEKAAALNEQQNPVSRTDLDKSFIQIGNHVARGKTLEEEATINMVSNSVEVSRCTRPCGEVKAPEDAQFVEAEENHQLVEEVDISNRLENVQFVEAEESHQLVDQVDISNRLENVEDFPASRCNQNNEGREQDHTQLGKLENPLTSDKVDVCGQFDDIEDNRKGACREDAKTHTAVLGMNVFPLTSDKVDVCGQFDDIKDNRKGACREDAKTRTTGNAELGDPTSSEKRKPVFLPFKLRGDVGVPKPPTPPKPSVLIHKKQNKKANLGSRENVTVVEIRKAATESSHMSIELAPKVTKKPMSPILQRIVNSRLVKTIAGKTNQSTRGKPLQDTVDIQQHPSLSLQQRTSRIRNIQCATVCRPFSFKSEDRAIKRKEFFERLQQNAKTKKKEIDEVQENSKVKPRNDAITQGGHLLSTSMVGPCSYSFRSRTPSDASKVIPELPGSPFVSGEKLKHNNARPPWRFTTSGKEVTAKKSQFPARPLKSVSKKSKCENASPNIRL